MNFFTGPGGVLNQLAGFQTAHLGHGGPSNPSEFDDYFKAYSVAMLPGKERDNVSYGGKIILPPSSLARLSALDLDGPWMFQLRNPANSAASTHAGVLEFIAEEGVCHLPYWMMKTLRLNEGDPIRITGCELRKGKFVKLQAQTVHFLEISDPKAVLEQALRNFSALTQGDIIEISYNSIVFGLLVMETQPGGEGISVLDTDLEVDFAAPVGYVEPERPKPPPPPTMASKMKIDLDASTPGSSRPTSSLGGGFKAPTSSSVSKNGDQWESFKGRGETLAGRKTKGKGISHKKPQEVAEGSLIRRTEKHKIVTNNTLEEDIKVPAVLHLPFGQLFFGFRHVPYQPPEPKEDAEDDVQPSFSGTGKTLNGRPVQPSSSAKDKVRNRETETSSHAWGSGGQTLGGSTGGGADGPVGAGGARAPRTVRRNTNSVQRERSPTPDWGVDSDDDVMMIDSD